MMQSFALMVIGALLCLLAVFFAFGTGRAHKMGDHAKAGTGVFLVFATLAVGVIALVIA